MDRDELADLAHDAFLILAEIPRTPIDIRVRTDEPHQRIVLAWRGREYSMGAGLFRDIADRRMLLEVGLGYLGVGQPCRALAICRDQAQVLTSLSPFDRQLMAMIGCGFSIAAFKASGEIAAVTRRHCEGLVEKGLLVRLRRVGRPDSYLPTEAGALLVTVLTTI